MKNYLREFAKNVDNTKRIEGPVFVVTLFSVAAILLSQTALFVALRAKLGG
jgi:hypothetical protein